jgi:hypothetical protein
VPVRAAPAVPASAAPAVQRRPAHLRGLDSHAPPPPEVLDQNSAPKLDEAHRGIFSLYHSLYLYLLFNYLYFGHQDLVIMCFGRLYPDQK